MLDPHSFVVCTPSRGAPNPHFEWARALNIPPHRYMTVVGKPVDVARNELARNVLAMPEPPPYVVFLDDDAFVERGTVERLISDLESAEDLSMVAAWFGPRGPTIHSTAGRFVNGMSVNLIAQFGLPMWSAPVLEHVDFVGLHCCVVRASVLEELASDPFTITTEATTEDVAFCERITRAGGSIAVDRTLPAYHLGRGIVYGDEHDVVYLPGYPSSTISRGILTEITDLGFRALVSRRSYGTSVDLSLDQHLVSIA